MTKSLKEAARALGVSEESLRRKILLGEIVATPVADDRQYLVAVGTAPSRRCPRFRLLLWCVAAWAVLGTCLALGTRRIGETCVQCGSRKGTELLFGVPMNSVAVEGVGRDCPHDWRRDGRR